MERVGGAGGGLHSLTENIGITAPAALTMMMRRAGNLANFESVMIWEPTFDEPRRARREALGRTPKAKPEQRANIAENVMSGQYTAAQMARLYKVGERTVSRLFAAHRPATEAEHVARR